MRCERPKAAQCALSTVRNLVRDEEAPVEVLVQNQAGGGPITGEYRFPDWMRVMTAMKLVRASEEVIVFRTSQLMSHEELEGVIMMVMATTEPFQHVVAVLEEEDIDSCGERTGVRFRVYDNDGVARRGGEGRLVSTRELADTSYCTTHALVEHGSVLHARAIANARPPPAARLRREMAEQAANTGAEAEEPPE